MQVLVIDDDPTIREMIFMMLSDENYDLLEASDGKEGLRIIQQNTSIQMVITDLIMPEKEGIETIREIRDKYNHIKILAISGGGKVNADNYLTLAKGMGADQILKKPFIKQQLLDTLNEIIKN